MARKVHSSSVKPTPKKQPQRRRPTQIGQLDTTPTRDRSPVTSVSRKSRNGGAGNVYRAMDELEEFDDGINDADLAKIQLAETKEIPATPAGKGFLWSENGSGTRRSSSFSSNGQSKNVFGYLGVETTFSSPARDGYDELPDTLPLPKSPGHEPMLESQGQAARHIDFSETATTIFRSSPFAESHIFRGPGASSCRSSVRVDVQDGCIDTQPQEPTSVVNTITLTDNAHEDMKDRIKDTSKISTAPKIEKLSQERKHGDDPLEPFIAETPNRGQNGRLLMSNCVFLDGASDRLDRDHQVEANEVNAEYVSNKLMKKRKQRAKAPLEFDPETQEVKCVPRKPARKIACKKIKIASPEKLAVPARGGIGKRKDDAAQRCKVATKEVIDDPPSHARSLLSDDDCIMLNTNKTSSVDYAINSADEFEKEEVQVCSDKEQISFELHEDNINDITEAVDNNHQTPSPSKSIFMCRVADQGFQDNLSGETPMEQSRPNVVTSNVAVDDPSIYMDLEKIDGKIDDTAEWRKVETTATLNGDNIEPSQLNNLMFLDNAKEPEVEQSAATVSLDRSSYKRSAVRPYWHAGVSQRQRLTASSKQHAELGSNPDKDPGRNALYGRVPTPNHEPLVTGNACREGNGTDSKSKRSRQSELVRAELVVAGGDGSLNSTSDAASVEPANLRQSLLSELREDQKKRRNTNGGTQLAVTHASDRGRQEVHNLVDVCMEHFDSKKASINKVVDTYTNAGNHCVGKIQSRFARERGAVVEGAKEHTRIFHRLVLDGIGFVERSSDKRRRWLKQLQQEMSQRTTAYASTKTALECQHRELLQEASILSGI
ncbi:hypothetical protein QQS21_001195 [Conoideocrella luteorostrata]|uniref:Uncharacterized protein n=1 Tax=Conoideocrella luteorostrata TaxID=1105319 RepID=A0AAJ0CXF2_9HYPO|nr:hypothetical protein QQS21_001195 [Conoideocrella luteorostrata]